MKHKHIRVMDWVFVVGTLIVLGIVGVSYYGAKPVLLSPSPGESISDNGVLFEFKVPGGEGIVLIDDNLEFTSPKKIFTENNIVINLEPGVYYWKVEGQLSSEVRQLTVESEVDFRLVENGAGGYSVVNAGTEILEVDVYQYGEKRGKVSLSPGESGNVVGDKFVGGIEE